MAIPYENSPSKGLITATEEVWIIGKHPHPIYFHQQCLIKHSSHLFSHSNHPSKIAPAYCQENTMGKIT